MTDRDEDVESTEDSAEAEAPEPRENPALIGHDAAEKALLQAYAADRLPHGLLITGPHGVGKATLAYRLARFLLAQRMGQGGGLFASEIAPPSTLAIDRDDPVFHRVASGGHADLVTVERGFDFKKKRLRTEILVEDIRALVEFLRLTPAEGGWRIAIIDPADEMNRSAANALLKILEEPPARAMLMLVSDNPGRLLPTIRSRCRILPLRPLSAAILDALLARYRPGLSAKDRSELAALSDGSIGRALALATDDGAARHRELIALMAGLPELDGAALHRIAGRVTGRDNDDAFRAMAELLPASLARAIARAARPEGESGKDEARLAALIRRRGLDRFVEVWEKINQLFAQADAINLDRKQVVLNAFFALEEAAR